MGTKNNQIFSYIFSRDFNYDAYSILYLQNLKKKEKNFKKRSSCKNDFLSFSSTEDTMGLIGSGHARHRGALSNPVSSFVSSWVNLLAFVSMSKHRLLNRDLLSVSYWNSKKFSSWTIIKISKSMRNEFLVFCKSINKAASSIQR